MALQEFLIGTTGPYFIDDTDPLFSDPRQVLTKGGTTGYLTVSDIVDSLVSTSIVRPLSAAQGKVLKDLYDSLLLHKDHIQLTNKTGAASVKGTVVTVDTTVDQAVKKIVEDQLNPIGVIAEDGIADGELVWVAVSGKAQVLFVGDTTRGHLARGFVTGDSGYIAGYAMSEAYPTPPSSSDKHFFEIGHVLESRTGAGLAWCVLHFN